jgi:hypothetical protein
MLQKEEGEGGEEEEEEEECSHYPTTYYSNHTNITNGRKFKGDVASVPRFTKIHQMVETLLGRKIQTHMALNCRITLGTKCGTKIECVSKCETFFTEKKERLGIITTAGSGPSNIPRMALCDETVLYIPASLTRQES